MREDDAMSTVRKRPAGYGDSTSGGFVGSDTQRGTIERMAFLVNGVLGYNP